MDLKRLFNDDDAVSPVIGVILMVAITVILAAVIASFVIGLGDENQTTKPSTTFEFDYDSGDDELTVSVGSGKNLDAEQVELTGTAGDTPPDSPSDMKAWSDYADSAKSGSTGTLSAGSSLTLSVDTDYDISVIWNDPDTENSFTMNSDSGPDA